MTPEPTSAPTSSLGLVPPSISTLQKLISDPRVVYAPMSELARKQTAALPPEAAEKSVELVVLCHTGRRSAQVTFWLQDLGWQNVSNLAGGIDAYARTINPEIGFY